MGMVKQSIPKVHKIASLQCLYNISKKKLEMKLIFFHADKHQSFLQVNFNTSGIKVSCKVILSLLMGMTRHSQSTQSSKFVMSLQYLKKEVRDVVHQSFYKLALLFLMEVARHVQSMQNRKLVIFLQYLQKNVSQLLLCSIGMQNIQIFYGVPVMFFATCLYLYFFLTASN